MDSNQPAKTSGTAGSFTHGTVLLSAGRRRRPFFIGGTFIGIVAIVVVAALIVHSHNKSPDISSSVASVGISSTGFVPSTIQIKKGQEIKFTNEDSGSHLVTANQTELPDFNTAQPLQTGDSYTYIFDKAGTYHYYDSSNPANFVGTVTVQ